MSSKEPVKNVAAQQHITPAPTPNLPTYDNQPIANTFIERARLATGSLTPHDVQRLQRTLGNQAVLRLYFSQTQPTTPEKDIHRNDAGGSSATGTVSNNVIQRVRHRRKEYKNERQRLSTEKRMGSVVESMEQAQQEQEDEAYEAEFDQYLSEAMSLILGEENNGVGGGVRFGSFWQAYDNKYWDAVEVTAQGNDNEDQSDSSSESNSETSESDSEDEEYNLVLKPGVKPAVAIDFLFADLDKWAFDCADAIQVARWYAMRHAMGAKEFNKSMSGMSFVLRSHNSTGLGSVANYIRTDDEGYYDKDEPLKFKRDGSSKSRTVTITAEEIVRRVPVGTQVLLTVDDESAYGTDFENENVVKVGPDQYAAHPLGIGTLDYIIEQVAMTALDLDDQDTIDERQQKKINAMRKKIYISEIDMIRKR